MAMLAQNEQLREFLNAISRSAQAHREGIRTQMEQLHQSELDKAREEAEAQARLLLQSENAKCRAAQNLRVSLEERQLRHALTERRAEIEQQVFQAAREELLRFTQSAEYTDFLRRSLEGMLHSLPKTPCVLLLRQADLSLGESLLPLLEKGSDLEMDTQIQIGGCKLFAPAQKRLLDDTLDARLAQQREWFRGAAGLCAWEQE